MLMLAGIGSVMTVELLSTIPVPELVAVMVYCTTAPGMNLGKLDPFTGSEMTATVLTTASDGEATTVNVWLVTLLFMVSVVT